MNTNSTMSELQSRFDNLLLSTKLANELLGKRAPGEVSFEESEQADARRRLLHVEKLAAQQKATLEKAQAKKLQAVSDELHKRVIAKITPHFSNSTKIASTTLGLSEDITALLDILSTRACSVSMLEPVIVVLPWLRDAILREVNLAHNRRLDAQGNPIVIESIKTALCAIGIESLKKLIPHLVFKHSTPQITAPYPEIKLKLSEFSLGLGNSMYRLASVMKQREFDAYLLGILYGLGRCACLRLYFREFDKTLMEFSQESMENKDQATYAALQLMQPAAENIIKLQQTFAPELTIRAFEYFTFKRMNLIQVIVAPEHAMHKTLKLAEQFTQLKMLIGYRLVDKQEAKQRLSELKIPSTWIDVLNQPGLFKGSIDYS